MSNKLPTKEMPAGCSPTDFQCFGPVATKDTQFEGNKMADLGCFSQGDVDSNKYYFAAVVQHKTTKAWYLYIEFGREGAKVPSYQYTECDSETEACREFVAKCHEKNTKRGEWRDVAGHQLFRPRGKDDLYCVRVLAKRSHGLPDAANINATSTSPAIISAPVASKAGKAVFRCDHESNRLMLDLVGGTRAFTRANLQGGTTPTAEAINEGRALLTAAEERLEKIGNSLVDQINDEDLLEITEALYSRIPKTKALHCDRKHWILTQDNLVSWEQDLDAFESVLKTGVFEETVENDPFANLPVRLRWIEPSEGKRQAIATWAASATRNRHGWLPGGMKVFNIWEVEHDTEKVFDKHQTQIAALANANPCTVRPIHQPKTRSDVKDPATYMGSNTAFLFHGTRSVNVAGILQSSLRMPKHLSGVALNGANFGRGIYFADDFKKSAGYCSLSGSYWAGGSGGIASRKAFLFIADVVLGKPHIAAESKGYAGPPAGHHSVGAVHGITDRVENNEWIVYKQEQKRLRYLLEFTA